MATWIAPRGYWFSAAPSMESRRRALSAFVGLEQSLFTKKPRDRMITRRGRISHASFRSD